MNIFALFKIIVFASSLISTFLACYVYTKRGNSLPLKFLSGLLFANLIYASSYFFEISAMNVAQIKLFLNMEYVGIFFIPIFWVFIAWSYHPTNPLYNQKLLRKLRILYILPVIMNLVVWTNDLHHLFYYSIDVDLTLPLSLLIVDRAPGFWIANGTIIVLYIVGTIRIFYNFIRSKGDYRKQYLLLTLATIPPFVSYLLILTQAVPYGLDLNSIAFALSGLLIFWGMDNLRLFNILPFAQKVVIDVMRDAVIVLDTKGCLIECNIPARMLLEDDSPNLTNVPLCELNPHLAPLFSNSSDVYEIDLELPHSGEIKTYSIYKSTITDRKNRTHGDLYLLHDLTEIRTYVKDLEHLASFDGLTNLLNHRQFINLATTEANRLEDQGFGMFSLIIFDLDNFKKINDNYGHRSGDRILEQIGVMVPQLVEAHNLCARYGGEEFVILLYNTPIDQATKYAEKIRSSIDQDTFIIYENELHITASFGVSTFSPTFNIPWETTLNNADTALYRAKDAGRNVVHTFQLPNSVMNNPNSNM